MAPKGRTQWQSKFNLRDDEGFLASMFREEEFVPDEDRNGHAQGFVPNPDMSQQRRIPTEGRTTHLQTSVLTSQPTSCGNTSRVVFTQRMHREKNVTLQDEQNMSQQRLTAIEDHFDDPTANGLSFMSNRAHTSFTERTQVGKRVVNGDVPEDDQESARHHNRRHVHVPSRQNVLMRTGIEQELEDEEGTHSSDNATEIRGPTYMKSIWGRPSNLPPIFVAYNEYGQPIEGEYSTLSHFLGTIARNSQFCPLDEKSWHAMSDGKKNEMLQLVKSRFQVPDKAEKWILSSIGKKWRNWKHSLKTRYWVENVEVEELISDRDERVPIDQWIKLVTYWKTEEAKKARLRNQVARSKKIMDQRTGKKSFAQVRARMTKEQGRPVSRVELVHSCFSTNGESSKARAVSSKYDAMLERSQLLEGSEDAIAPNDVFAQVMGKDKAGHVRMMGHGVCPSDVWGQTSRIATNHEVMEYEAQIAELKAEIARQRTSRASLVGTTRQEIATFESHSQHAAETLHVQVGTYAFLRSVSTNKVVAKGFIHSTDPTTKVGGQMLGLNWCEVNVKAILEPNEQLIRPYGNFRELSQTLGHMIAWPLSLVTPNGY